MKGPKKSDGKDKMPKTWIENLQRWGYWMKTYGFWLNSAAELQRDKRRGQGRKRKWARAMYKGERQMHSELFVTTLKPLYRLKE